MVNSKVYQQMWINGQDSWVQSSSAQQQSSRLRKTYSRLTPDLLQTSKNVALETKTSGMDNFYTPTAMSLKWVL